MKESSFSHFTKITAAVLAFLCLSTLGSFSNQSIAAEEPSTASDIIVFEQDYTKMTIVPDNIFMARIASSPYLYNTHLSYSNIDNAVLFTKYKGEVGECWISGLIPARTTTYNLTVAWYSSYTTSWAGAAFSISIGGTVIYCTHGSNPLNPYYSKGQYYNETGSLVSLSNINLGTTGIMNIEVTSYIENATCHVDINGNKYWIPFYRNTYTSDIYANVYTPTSVQFGSAVATDGGSTDYLIGKISYLRQTINKTGDVFAIASTTHQAIGYDGPHNYTTTLDGMERIRSAGMTGTLFVDIGYIENDTFLAYMKVLQSEGWEIGIHYSEGLENLPYEESLIMMEEEYNIISDVFGVAPKMWCSLGNDENDTHVAYGALALNMIWRTDKIIPQNLPGSKDMINASYDYWYGVAIGGTATVPMYLHETELEPATSAGIDKSLWDAYLDIIFEGPIKLVSYYEWYMIQANQFDATYTTEITDYGTEITANTNGYTAMTILKDAPTDETIIMDQDGEQIAYSTTPEGYIIFEAEDDGVYLITTLADYRAMLMSEAYSPLYALLPVVITMVVIAGVIEMVVGIRKKF